MSKFNGRVALITGGASGLGEATAMKMDASTRQGNEEAVQFAVKTYGT